MSRLRITVMMLVFALSLSGWATQGHARGDASFQLFSAVAGPGVKADLADCAEASGSQAHHDHSDAGDGANCCHMISPALELYSPSAYPPGWYVKAAFVPVHPDSATGLMPAPTLRPPRI